MKRYLLSFYLLLTAVASAVGMGYREAREYAYFLTDKMAYELELSAEQYDRIYEVNLDYLLALDHRRDIFGHYWEFRNIDLRYLLTDWQYARFCATDDFYRPLSWRYGRFVVHVYNRYRLHNYYYDYPTVYRDYRGSQWGTRRINAPSPYSGYVVNGRYGGTRETYPSRHYGNSYNRPGYSLRQGVNTEHYGSEAPTRRYGNRGTYETGNRSYDVGAGTSDIRYRSSETRIVPQQGGRRGDTPPRSESFNAARAPRGIDPSVSGGATSRSGVVSGRR